MMAREECDGEWLGMMDEWWDGMREKKMMDG
jgi:hypothetical protein